MLSQHKEIIGRYCGPTEKILATDYKRNKGTRSIVVLAQQVMPKYNSEAMRLQKEENKVKQSSGGIRNQKIRNMV